MIHGLKILPQYFKEVVSGNKTFEIRKNDRGFKAGDTILLKEYINKFEGNSNLPYAGYYTGQEITKEISYILEGGQYGLEEGYCILGLKQDGIKLKNIDLNGISIEEQVKKIQEEDREFVRAINESDLENAKEEFWDLIQARLGLLDKLGIKAEEVMKGYSKHIEKLEKRGNKPRIKECSKCIRKDNCKLYLNKNWTGEKEAENCRTYMEQEE